MRYFRKAGRVVAPRGEATRPASLSGHGFLRLALRSGAGEADAPDP